MSDSTSDRLRWGGARPSLECPFRSVTPRLLRHSHLASIVLRGRQSLSLWQSCPRKEPSLHLGCSWDSMPPSSSWTPQMNRCPSGVSPVVETLIDGWPSKRHTGSFVVIRSQLLREMARRLLQDSPHSGLRTFGIACPFEWPKSPSPSTLVPVSSRAGSANALQSIVAVLCHRSTALGSSKEEEKKRWQISYFAYLRGSSINNLSKVCLCLQLFSSEP